MATQRIKLRKRGSVTSLRDHCNDEEILKKDVIFTEVVSQHATPKNLKAFAALFLIIFFQKSIRSMSFFLLEYTSDRLLDQITYEILTQDLSSEQAFWRGMRQEQVTVVESQRRLLGKSKQGNLMSRSSVHQTMGVADDVQDNVILPPLELVISHCDQSLDWIFEDLMSDNVFFGNDIDSSLSSTTPNIVNITVFSKCGWPVKGIPPNYPYALVRLPNVGRNDHSFAHWLSNQEPSNNNNNVVLFLKDNGNIYRKFGRQRPLREVAYIAQGGAGFGCREERLWFFMRPLQQIQALRNGENSKVFRHYKPAGFSFVSCALSFFHYRSKLLKYTISDYHRLKRDGMNSFKSPYADMGEWLEKAVFAGNPSDFSLLFSPSTSLVPVCYGGNFAARRSQIGRNPQWLYKNMASSLERGDNIAEGHFAERSWAALLSNPLSVDDEQILLDYQSSGDSSWCRYSHRYPSAMTTY